MVQYRRKLKQKLKRRNRRTNRNGYSSIWNTNVEPYREYELLPVNDKRFILHYISIPENQRNDLNIRLAKMNNKDEIWYNIWHQERNPNYLVVPEAKDLYSSKDKVTPSLFSETLYFNDFDTNRDMMDYLNNYYNLHGFFDYSLPFMGYSSIGSYMDINKLSPDNLYKLFELYYSNK